MCNFVCMLLGGPVYKMPVNGKIRLYEMHPYCGPSPLNHRTGDPFDVDKAPAGFWKAWDLFDAGGRKMDGDLCLLPKWCETCRRTGNETKHHGGRHYEIIGPCKACNGARVVWPLEAP